MSVTIDLWSVYTSIGAFIFSSIITLAAAMYMCGVVKWYESYTAGEERSRIDIIELFGIEFHFFGDCSEYSSSVDHIGPLRLIPMFIMFTIFGGICAVFFGATWFISVPVFLFMRHAKKLHRQSKSNLPVVVKNTTNSPGPK